VHSTIVVEQRPLIPALRRFARTPKGLLVVVLAVLTAIAAASDGVRLVAPGLTGAIVAAMAVDAPILRVGEGQWVFPDGAMLTGWIIAMILSPHDVWWVAAVTSVVAIASKHAFRGKSANVFNPAALALVVTFYVFDTGQSWWGALAEGPPVALVALFATGIFITDRVKKVPLVLSFLGVYYLLVTVGAFVSQPAQVAELYRVPDVNAALFFAFFMLTDPPTSPPRYRDQLWYGAIAAAAGFAVFELLGAAHFLLSGLLVANAWEWWRRRRTQRKRSVSP